VTRAETVARGVDGVRSVDNRLSVGTANSTVLTGSPSASAAVDSAGRAVDRAADSAGRAASNAAESLGRVAGRAGDAIGDAALTAKVKAALLADADVKGMQIDVDTKNGAVTLTGTLERRANAERAEQIARRIEGVRSVDNRLAVKAPG
jgi:osmotically-inducible protein OsmY